MRTLSTATPRMLLDGMSAVNGASASGAFARVIRMESLAALVAQSFSDLSIAYVVTGSQVPLQRLRRAVVTLPGGVAAVAVRCEPGAEPTVRHSRELTVLTVGALGDLAHLLARGAVR